MKKSVLLLIVLCGLLLSGCAKSSQQSVYTGPPLNDIEFAKKVFQLLGDGDEMVKSMIDWEHLKMMGVDVGAMYTKTSGDAARDKETSEFIRGYSRSFKGSGGSVDNLANWREQSRDATNTVVAADTQRGQLVLITVHSHRRSSESLHVRA